MRKITEINSSAKQRLTIVGENNEQIPFKLFFNPTQRTWFFDIEFEGLVIKGRRLSTAPNILHQWRNKLPFGIMCIRDDGLDPFLVDDFQTGKAVLFLLNGVEKQQVTTEIIEARV